VRTLVPMSYMDKMDPCSDTVNLGSSIGKQKQSTRRTDPAFSFGSSSREKAMKSSLSHAEIMRMPTTLFQPHMMKVPFRGGSSSFGKQLTSNSATSANFHFGSATQQDVVVVDKKLNNCADNLAKKELRWKHHVAFENKCLGIKGAEWDRSEQAPLFMQSTIRATEASPYYIPNNRIKKEKHTAYVYGSVPQLDDPFTQRSSRPSTAGRVPALALQQSASSIVMSPVKSTRRPGTSQGTQRSSQRSVARSEQSRPRTSSSHSSRASQRMQVQDWIQSEFGKCGDQLFNQITDASSSIASNNTRLGSMLDALSKIEQKATAK